MPTKIINCKAIIILLLMVYLSACSNAREEKNDRLFRMMDESLIRDKSILEETNKQIHRAIIKNLDDPEAYEIAKKWQSNALLVSNLSTDMNLYFGGLKNSVIPNNDIIKAMYDKLYEYRKALIGIDSEMTEDVKQNFNEPKKPIAIFQENVNMFKNVFSEVTSIAASNAIISKYQNDVRVVENKMLLYCMEKTVIQYSCGYLMNMQSVITSFSSKHAKPGETIELTAGLGNFYPISKTSKISINDKPIKTDAEGFAVMTIKASNKYGKHYVPVRVEWKDYETGQVKIITREVVYYVDSIPTKP